MIGVIIKQLRTMRGLTQLQFGEKIGVAESTISLYESGKRSPDFVLLGKIADFFAVSTDYLLGRTNIAQTTSSTNPQEIIKNHYGEVVVEIIEMLNSLSDTDKGDVRGYTKRLLEEKKYSLNTKAL